jgi:hypothetical protein
MEDEEITKQINSMAELMKALAPNTPRQSNGYTILAWLLLNSEFSAFFERLKNEEDIKRRCALGALTLNVLKTRLELAKCPIAPPSDPQRQDASPGDPQRQGPSPGDPQRQGPSPGDPQRQGPSPGDPASQDPSPSDPQRQDASPDPQRQDASPDPQRQEASPDPYQCKYCSNSKKNKANHTCGDQTCKKRSRADNKLNKHTCEQKKKRCVINVLD